MCGRYALWTNGGEIGRAFGLAETPEVVPSYNIAPGGPVLAIAWSKEAQPRLLAPRLLWGFPLPGGEEATINARSETADRKPVFSEAWRSRRCAVPFDAFYEWDKRSSPSQPWAFRSTGGVLAFAAIYAPLPERLNRLRYGVALFTTEPNAVVAEAHHRMPVVLQPEEALAWIDRQTAEEDLKALCRPADDRLLEGWPVARTINPRDVDSPWLLKAAP